MPNLEKESESVSTDGSQQLSRDDMAKLVGQRLESLCRAGLTHLPKGNGEYAFEPSRPSESQTVVGSPKATKVAQPGPHTNRQSSSPPQPAVARPSGVKESVSSYQAQGSTPPSASASSQDSANASPQATSPPSNQSNTPSVPSLPADAYGPSLPASGRVSALKVLQDEVARCTQCSELAGTRSQTVFGVGNPSTRLVLLGEGPGAEEDRVGEPFVGAAGQLLDKIVSACTLSRSDVYILNTVKCRPPGNRNPSQSELANCWCYAERQLEIIQPEFICCLGSVAARTLLKTTLSIGKLRRQLHSYRGSRVLVTYHPAYLLRTPSAKKHVWEDMKFLMGEMGVELSK